MAEQHQDFTLEAADTGTTLAAALRRRLPGTSWSDVRALCATGKVRLDGERAIDPAARVRAGQQVQLRPNAPRPTTAPPGFKVVFDDAHLVVIEKPSGISSVPYERKETGTAMDLIRAAWKRAGRRATATPLYVVHRIDKDTSGLLCFAKTRLAERALHTTFQRHEADRAYLALAEGNVAAQRIESHLVADRGDGIRGSTRHAGQGQRAITFVEPVARYPRGGTARATLCRVRLETGRTHQIRIHLSERGHPLVGETVYVRDLLRAGRQPMAAARLMLHAALLGLAHPVTGEKLEFRAPPPEDFMVELERVGGVRDDARV
ncbi:MAG TPA: RluA family pseudouridine synthase [Polyangia bacterium]|nr:RluA family pseudouridine synthase [Polyangia bacterium]